MTLAASMLLVASAATDAQASKKAKVPLYTGSISASGTWHSTNECDYSWNSSWTFGGTYYATDLAPGSALDAKTRTAGGSIDWTLDTCLGSTESGQCPVGVESPPSGHFAGYEDVGFYKARGGLMVDFIVWVEGTGPGCHGYPYGGIGGEWLEQEGHDPEGFLPAEKIGQEVITVPISSYYNRHSADNVESGEMSATLTLKRVGSPLQADPGGPYTVRRAGRVKLDGSGSKPRPKIAQYIWSFKPVPGDCPEDVPSRTTRKEGRETSVVGLCGVRATLTVVARNGDRDSARTVVNVRPRGPKGWRTPFAHREKTGDSRAPHEAPSATSMGGGTYAFSVFGGLNVSDCGAASASSEILCPLLVNGSSWLGTGYELAKVNDSNGPFDGFSYVASSPIKVKRAGLINPAIRPGSPFYQHNLQAGRDVTGFLNAIRQHEGLGNGAPGSGHSLIMKTILESPTGDARRVIERLFAADREGARRRVDTALHAIERRLDRESEDPLPDIWTGDIDFYDAYQQRWITGQGFRIPGAMRG